MRILAFCSATLWLILPAAHAADLRAFRYQKSLTLPPITAETLVGVALDAEIDEATRLGYPDLRIIASPETETPFSLRIVHEYQVQKVRQEFAPRVEALKEVGRAIEVTLRLDEHDPSVAGFSVKTPLKDFERKVRVLTSADGTNWTPLQSAVIYDYSRYMDVRQTEFALPETKARLFRIVIDDITEEKESPYLDLTRSVRGGEEIRREERTQLWRRPFRIDRITAWHVNSQQRIARATPAIYPPAGFQVENDSAQKRTVITVETRREPLTGFTLETPSRNFQRRARVQIPGPSAGARRPGPSVEEWQTLGEGTVARIGLEKSAREELSLAFPESRHSRYRIVIEDADNPPIAVAGVRAVGVVYRAVFLAQPNQTYRVVYGSQSAEAPRYDADSVQAALRGEQEPREASLGPQSAREVDAEPGEPVLRVWLNNWYFLSAAILAMVVLLGWLLFRASQRIAQLPPQS